MVLGWIITVAIVAIVVGAILWGASGDRKNKSDGQ